ncbi:MAG: histidine kinase [Pseudonocardiales bacterium]|nr:histidine kinase [Pseudonocardiales bacterium]
MPQTELPERLNDDLDDCALEPIHIPGSIQPRGALLVVREPELIITAVSENLAALVGVEPADAVGRTLADVLGAPAGAAIAHSVAVFGDLRNPLEVTVPVHGTTVSFDAILNRSSDSLLLVELELTPAISASSSVHDTYFAVRRAVSELDVSDTLSKLYDVTAAAVRGLTGFDRVMIYVYDDEFNGEVVAESAQDGLESFLGLHYPATDIPAQARALYVQNHTRLISDVNYRPALLWPGSGAADAGPLDLTHSTLRSVSPIHLEYLRNMGVRASMSVSLLTEGRLWGLIACHHYSSARTATYGARSAAEFLASTLSLRVADHAKGEVLQSRSHGQAVLTKLTAATVDLAEPIADALLGGPSLLDLIPADGVAVTIEGRVMALGAVPGPDAVLAIAGWMRARGEDVFLTDYLSVAAPHLGVPEDIAAGVLAVPLPDGQHLMWFRGERRESMDWGGDPDAKTRTVQDGGTARIGPRTSFARWRQEARLRSRPWTEPDRVLALELRTHLVEMLYTRSQHDLRMAEALQRSLLPQALPAVPGWSISAHYDTAEAGHVGGDWYDAMLLRDGTLAAVLGDVAGHGIGAAGTMAQLRNALRSQLLETASPGLALEQLNRFMLHLLPGAFATAAVARLDPGSGRVQLVRAGHLPPFIVAADGSVTPAPVPPALPLGVNPGQYLESEFVLDPGATLVMYSDGLVERRHESLDAGIERLARALAAGGPAATAPQILAAATEPGARDDTTVIALHRSRIA